MKRLLLALGAALVVLVAFAAPVRAHAQLEATAPSSGAVLHAPPALVSLSFSETVEVSLGAIRVYDANGVLVGRGSAFHPAGRASTVALRLPHLGRGAYVVTWRVLSADSHPVHGAFTFRVGSAPARDTEALVRRLVAADGGSTTVGVVYGLTRFLAFIGLTALLGAAVFLLRLWPEGRSDPRMRRLVAVAWGLAVTATAACVVLQAVHGAGLGLPDVGSVAGDVGATRFGRAWLARLALLLVGAPLLRGALRAPPDRGRAFTVGLGGIAIGVVVATSVAGHAGAESPAALAVVADAWHLGAAGVWLGGLAAMALVLWRRPDAAGIGAAVERFSPVAFGCVIVLLATGLLQGWRQSGSVDALTATPYGRLVLVKLGLFTAMVALGWLSRSWMRRHLVGRLRRSIAGEALIALLVLAVTAVLVNAVPAKVALTRPYSTELVTPKVLIDVTIDPAKRGPADVHIYTLSPAGEVTEVAELTAELRLPSRSLGPIRVPLTRAGPGHFSAYAVELPLPGRWELDVVARLTDVDQVRASTKFTVR